MCIPGTLARGRPSSPLPAIPLALITAGLAVALQNVVLASLGYLLLVGRLGIKIGDLVQVSGVTGYISDIGLLDGRQLRATTTMRQALEQGTFEARVRADFKGGVRNGVNGTSTFFINGQRHDAAVEYGDFVAAVERVLTLK